MQWSSYLSNLSDRRQSAALEAAVDDICPKRHVFHLTTHVSSRLLYYCFICRHHGLLQTDFCEIALQDKFPSPELSLPLPIHPHGAGWCLRPDHVFDVIQTNRYVLAYIVLIMDLELMIPFDTTDLPLVSEYILVQKPLLGHSTCTKAQWTSTSKRKACEP